MEMTTMPQGKEPPHENSEWLARRFIRVEAAEGTAIPMQAPAPEEQAGTDAVAATAGGANTGGGGGGGGGSNTAVRDGASGGSGIVVIRGSQDDLIPVFYNGTQLAKIIYNGVTVGSLVYNGTKLYMRRIRARLQRKVRRCLT